MDHLDPNVSLFAVARAPELRQFRSQAVRERCGARIYPQASRHKSRYRVRSLPSCVYVPKRVDNITRPRSCQREFDCRSERKPERLNAFAILARKLVQARDERKSGASRIFKDLKQRNAELFLE